MIAFASYVEMQAEDNFKQSFSEWLKVRSYSSFISFRNHIGTLITNLQHFRPEQKYPSK